MRGAWIQWRKAERRIKQLEEKLKAMQQWLSPETMAEMEKHGWVFE
tara:strand:- start:73 stop:210 length:138 start_codon:yes stop_codon:yes gene_type:complete